MSTLETRTKLLETALTLIWGSSYNSVGVNEICKQAGVTKGAFYHHFESKASLFCEATEFYWESTKKELDDIMSPVNPPLAQLEGVIDFVFKKKFDQEADSVRGSPFFTAGSQTGCHEECITDSLKTMCTNGVIYNSALVRTLHSDGFLEGESIDVDRIARLMSQYIQGAVSFARVEGCITNIKRDLPEGLYRIIGLKKEFWFSEFSSNRA